jgi:hypothetical protein
MKKIFILSFFIILFSVPNYSQSNVWYTGADFSYFMPIGSLKDRFEPATGYSFVFGKETSQDWIWFGKVEYFNFDKPNYDRLTVKRKFTVDGVEKQLSFPLTKLDMNLEVIGLSVNANINYIRTEIFETNLNFGFGVYKWIGNRRDFIDSLFTKNAADSTLFVDYIDVPEKQQSDWSGGLNFGIEAAIKIYEPVWFTVGAQYKIVIGELWSALKIDLENVSTFQMGEIRAGLRFKLDF